MRLDIIVNKQANFYFFAQNLSEWHFSNRKDYNTLWRKELGKFSDDEELAIKHLKKIHLRYSFGKSYLGRHFFLEENPWFFLKTRMAQEDFITLKNIFSLLEDKFNLFWSKEAPLLLAWQKELANKADDHLMIENIIELLKIIFNTNPSTSEVAINLLPSSPVHTGGGANIDSKNITLEISRYPKQGTNHAMSLIWHEIIHLCFQEQYFSALVSEKLPNDRQKADLINEIAIRSLFPRGILGIRLFKEESRRKLIEETNPEQTVKIIDLAKEYVDDKKSFDNTYIEKILEILKI
ncbi:MAG: hypothetical protein WDZ85_02180 [Candidatus Paceibacterota bacterium]